MSTAREDAKERMTMLLDQWGKEGYKLVAVMKIREATRTSQRLYLRRRDKKCQIQTEAGS